MIALDLCQPHYQVSLIIYLKFKAKNVEIKIANLSVILLGLKIINYIKKCNECKKRQLKPINELIKKFLNTYEFCNGDINKFILLLRKGVYPYEYMNSWERFDETSLLDKKSFYNELNLEDITDKDYTHVQKVFEELKSLHEKTLVITAIYELDPAHFLSASGLAWQACLKKKQK